MRTTTHGLTALLLVGLLAWLAGSGAGPARAVESESSETGSHEAVADRHEAGQWHPVTEDSPPPLSVPMQALRDKVRRTLAWYFHRPESPAHRSPWAVMHCIIAFGVDSTLAVGNQRVNAIAWLCSNAPCYQMQLLHVRNDRLAVRMGPGYQGHEGQLLSILAQGRVKQDYPLLVDGRRLSVADLIEYEKWTCRGGSELTFKLIGLSHYLDSDAVWQALGGETWDISRLLQEELAQSVIGACCGGTHRLTGFSYAVHNRRRDGRPVDGQWARAEKYLQDYHRYTFALQNADGSFSTSWFERPNAAGDLDRRLNTTGHILEWLVCSLPEEQLQDRQVVLAVDYLSDLLWTYRQHRWEIGARGHALHALSLYDQRVFGGRPGRRDEELAVVRYPAVATVDGATRRPPARRAR